MKKTIFEYYKGCLTKKNYANFSGRARRAELNSFYLVLISKTLPIMGLCCCLFFLGKFPMLIYGLLALLGTYVLLIITPTFALITRRLHDLGYSIWMTLPTIFIISIVKIQTWAFILVRFFGMKKLGGLVPAVGQFEFLFFIVGFLLGFAFSFMLFFKEGTKGANQYGPDPKAKK